MATPAPPARPTISTLAVVAALTALIALPLVPALVGTAALSDIRNSSGTRHGRRLALTAIALGIFWFAAESGLAFVLILKPEILLSRFFHDRIVQGHASGTQALYVIAAQQELFRRDDEDSNEVHDYWSADISSLYQMATDKKGHPEQIGLDIAAADSSALNGSRAVARDGYLVRTVPGVDKLTQYAATAYPETYGVDGLKTFYLDERGVVWSRDLGGLPAVQRFDDPQSEGWQKESAR